jgi:hypothetical protein
MTKRDLEATLLQARVPRREREESPLKERLRVDDSDEPWYSLECDTVWEMLEYLHRHYILHTTSQIAPGVEADFRVFPYRKDGMVGFETIETASRIHLAFFLPEEKVDPYFVESLANLDTHLMMAELLQAGKRPKEIGPGLVGMWLEKLYEPAMETLRTFEEEAEKLDPPEEVLVVGRKAGMSSRAAVQALWETYSRSSKKGPV